VGGVRSRGIGGRKAEHQAGAPAMGLSDQVWPASEASQLVLRLIVDQGGLDSAALRRHRQGRWAAPTGSLRRQAHPGPCRADLGTTTARA